MSKLVSEVPPASNLMKKLLHPMNLLDVKIVTVCRVVECSKTSDLIGMSFVVRKATIFIGFGAKRRVPL